MGNLKFVIPQLVLGRLIANSCRNIECVLDNICYLKKQGQLIHHLGLGSLSKIHLKPAARYVKQTYGIISKVVDMYY